MATSLTIGSPKRIALSTTTEQITIPRDARYLRIEALTEDVVLAVTGTDGGALASDFETYPKTGVYMRSLPGTQGKARHQSDAVVFVAVASGTATVAFTAMFEGA